MANDEYYQKKKKIYDAASSLFNVGDEQTFMSKLDDEEKRKKLYDALSEKYNIGDYDTFSQKMGYSTAKTATEDAGTQAEAATQQVNSMTGGAVNDGAVGASAMAQTTGQTGTVNEADQQSVAMAQNGVGYNYMPMGGNIPTWDKPFSDEFDFQQQEYEANVAAGMPTTYRDYEKGVNNYELAGQGGAMLADIEQMTDEEFAQAYQGTMGHAYRMLWGEKTSPATVKLNGKGITYDQESELRSLVQMAQMKADAEGGNDAEVQRYEARANELLGEGGAKKFNEYLQREVVDGLNADVDAKLAEVSELLKYQQRTQTSGWSKGLMLAAMGTGTNAVHGAGAFWMPQWVKAEDMPVSNETDKYEVAAQILKGTKKHLEEYDKEQKDLVGQSDFEKKYVPSINAIGRGTRDALTDLGTWDFGLTDLRRYSELLSVVNKWEKNEELTAGEQALLDAAATQMAVEANARLNGSYNAGVVTGEMAPFMLEIALNPIAKVGEGAGSKVARYMLSKGVGRKMSKFVGGVARAGVDMAVTAPGMALTTGSLKTAGQIENRMIGDIKYEVDDNGRVYYDGAEGREDISEAVWKGLAQQSIEYQSEMVGEYLAPMSRMIGKAMRAPVYNKLGEQYYKHLYRLCSGIGDGVMPKAIRVFGKTAKIVKKNGKVSDWAGETTEEIVGGLENAWIGTTDQNAWEGGDAVLSWNNISETALMMLPSQIMFAGLPVAMGGAGYTINKSHAIHREITSNSRAKSLIGKDRWQQMKQRIDEADADNIVAVTKELTGDESGLSNRQKVAVAQYVIAKQYMKGMKMAQGLYRTHNMNAMVYGTALDKGEAMKDPSEVSDWFMVNTIDEENLRKSGISDVDMWIDAIIKDPAEAMERMYRNARDYRGNVHITEEQMMAAERFAQSASIMRGVQNRLSREGLESQTQFNDDVRASTHKDGQLHPVVLADGRRAYVTAGTVVAAPDGTVDMRATDSFVTIYVDGNPESVGKNQIASVGAIQNPFAAIDANNKAMQKSMNDSFKSLASGTVDASNGNDVYVFTDGNGSVGLAKVMGFDESTGMWFVNYDGGAGFVSQQELDYAARIARMQRVEALMADRDGINPNAAQAPVATEGNTAQENAGETADTPATVENEGMVENTDPFAGKKLSKLNWWDAEDKIHEGYGYCMDGENWKVREFGTNEDYEISDDDILKNTVTDYVVPEEDPASSAPAEAPAAEAPVPMIDGEPDWTNIKADRAARWLANKEESGMDLETALRQAHAELDAAIKEKDKWDAKEPKVEAGGVGKYQQEKQKIETNRQRYAGKVSYWYDVVQQVKELQKDEYMRLQKSNQRDAAIAAHNKRAKMDPRERIRAIEARGLSAESSTSARQAVLWKIASSGMLLTKESILAETGSNHSIAAEGWKGKSRTAAKGGSTIQHMAEDIAESGTMKLDEQEVRDAIIDCMGMKREDAIAELEQISGIWAEDDQAGQEMVDDAELVGTNPETPAAPVEELPEGMRPLDDAPFSVTEDNAEADNRLSDQRLTESKEWLDRKSAVEKAFGIKIVESNDFGDNENGRYDASNRTIYVNSHLRPTVAVGWVIGHELTHRMKDVSGRFEEYKQSVIDYMGEEQFLDEVSKRVKLYAKHGKKLSIDDAMEEVCADFGGSMLHDGKLMDRFLERQNMNFIQKLIADLRDMMAKAAKWIKEGELSEIDSAIGRMESMMAGAEKGSTDAKNEVRKSITEDETLGENYGDVVRYSIVDDSNATDYDRQVMQEIADGRVVKVFRAMQVIEIDGKRYALPPMASKINGEWVEGLEIRDDGTLEPLLLKADEHPELADDKGNFKLDKGNGKSVPARYNPYWHVCRGTMLNDQFAEAQSRPNLITVEGIIPESELSAGYKAEKAKDAVGSHDWKPGIIQGQIVGKREVILSRYFHGLRVIPDDVVAKDIFDFIDGKVDVMPTNVVPPAVRAELEKLGVQFVETDNLNQLIDGEHKGDRYTWWYGKNAEKNRAKKFREEANDAGMKLSDWLRENGREGQLTASVVEKADKAWEKKHGKRYSISVDHGTVTDADGAVRFSITTEPQLESAIMKYANTADARRLGWVKEQIGDIVQETSDLIDMIHSTIQGDVNYDEFAKKNPTVRVDWRDGKEKPVVTWVRNNIEYKYDMSADTFCINNEAMETVLASPVMADLMIHMAEFGYVENKEGKTGFDADDYLRLYETLRDMGFVVPCKGCFDAAARFKMLPSTAQKFVNLVNATIDERNQDPEKFDAELKEIAKSGKKITIEGFPAGASTQRDAVRIGVAGDKLTEHISWTQLMSAEGQTKALTDWGGIFRAWQRTGAGRPKDKLLPEPYTGQIMERGTTIIAPMGEKTPAFRDLYVNRGTGLRRNSHSEYRPILVVDEMQFMRDAWLKGLCVFKYMKELDDVRLFGRMGVKFNMSAFAAFVPGGVAAGLDADGNYAFAEESVGGREFEYVGPDGKTHYDGQKGFEEAKKYINKDCSLSCVAFSVPHLIKLLTDVPTPTDRSGQFGSVIPFHPSGATNDALEKQGLGRARANGVGHSFEHEAYTGYDEGVTSFEQNQNDRFGKGWRYAQGKKQGNDAEGHKIEFQSCTIWRHDGRGITYYASRQTYENNGGVKGKFKGLQGPFYTLDSENNEVAHPFSVDYNDKVRELGGKYAYKEAADYYIKELRRIGLMPRFDFDVPADVYVKMCEDARVDPHHPKLGWKGEGKSWSPCDAESYYSLFCDYGMTDPETGYLAPHRPVLEGKKDPKAMENAMGDNYLEVIADGVRRYSERKGREDAKVEEAIVEYCRRSVEDGKMDRAEADGILKKHGVRMSISQDEQIHSDAFKRWFGDWERDPENSSKVVDDEGRPLVVYHHTNAKEIVNRKTGEKYDDLDWMERDYWQEEASQEEWDDTWVEQDFNVFDNSYARRSVEVPGFFFAPKEFEDEGYGKRRITAYLDIKNPIVDPDFSAMGFDRGSRDNVMEEAMKHLQKLGYDGIINTEDGKPYEYIAFYPNQIKSATDNNGDFDRSNPDIRYSLNMSDQDKKETTDRIDYRIDQLLKENSDLIVSSGSEPDLLTNGEHTPGEAGATRTESSGANVSKKFRDAKEISINLARFISNMRNDEELTTSNFTKKIYEGMGYNPKMQSSDYAKVLMNDGTKVSIRLSDHKGNALSIIKKGGRADEGYSIVVKLDNTDVLPDGKKDKFKPNQWSDVTEFVYIRPDIDRMEMIAKSIFALVDEGIYYDLADADDVGISPREDVKMSLTEDNTNSENPDIRYSISNDTDNNKRLGRRVMDLKYQMKKAKRGELTEDNWMDFIYPFKGWYNKQRNIAQYNAARMAGVGKKGDENGTAGAPEDFALPITLGSDGMAHGMAWTEEQLERNRAYYRALNDEMQPIIRQYLGAIDDVLEGDGYKASDWVKVQMQRLRGDVEYAEWFYAEMGRGHDVYMNGRGALRPIFREGYSTRSNNTEGMGFDAVEAAAEAVAERLGVTVNVRGSVDEVRNEYARREIERQMRNRENGELYLAPKAWFDRETGEVEVYAPMAESASDVEKSVLHEVVGHKGLRKLLSGNEAEYRSAMMDCYDALNAEQRGEVTEQASRMGYDYAEAMDEWLARRAEDGAEKPAWWRRVAAVVRNLLRKMGIDVELSDGDVRYLLWRSRKTLENGGKDSAVDMAEDTVMRWQNLGRMDEEVNGDGGPDGGGVSWREDEVETDSESTDEDAGVRMSITDDVRDLERKVRERDREIDKLRNQVDRLRRSREQISEVREKARQLINKLMTPEAGYQMGATQIRGLISTIDNAQTAKDVDRALDNISVLIGKSQLKAEMERINKYLKAKTQSLNARGQAKGVLVDAWTARIIDQVRSTYKDLLQTRIDTELSMKSREISRMGAEINQMRAEGHDAQADERMAEQERLKQERDELKELRDDIRAQKTAETIEILERDNDALNTQIDDLTANGKEIPDELLQEKLSLPIRIKIAMLRNMIEQKNKAEHESSDALDKSKLSTDWQEVERLETLAKDKAMEAESVRTPMLYLAREIGDELKDLLDEGKSKRHEQIVAEIEHRKEIVRMGIAAVKKNAVQDPNAPISDKEERGQRMDKLISKFNATALSFNHVMKMIDVNHPGGEGTLYDYFMRGEHGAVAANDQMDDGIKEFTRRVDEKCTEVFGKPLKKVMAECREVDDSVDIPLAYTEDSNWHRKGDTYSTHLSKGQALYVWLTWRQEQGRKKLERHGWNIDSIRAIEDYIGTGMMEFGEWVTEEFLPELREDKYSPTYERVYGTPLHKAYHYFPIHIFQGAVVDKDEIGERSPEGAFGSIAGNTVVRTENNLPINVSTDAFEALLTYGTKMERFNAMAELQRDLNILRGSKAFRDMVEANHAGMFDRWKQACQVCVGTYSAKMNDFSDLWGKIQSGFMQQAIGFRWYTALKQMLSFPAFYAYSGDAIYMANLSRRFWTPVSNAKWARENLPSYRQRIAKGDMGIEGLNDKTFFDTVTGKISSWGMWANKTVDSLTVAAGARAVFEHDYKRYLKEGKSEEEARRLAIINAEICFNESQQSSRPEFSAPIQKDRDLLSRGMNAFQNSNIGYRRAIIEGWQDIMRAGDMYKRGKITKEEKNQTVWRGIRKVVVFAVILPGLWQLGIDPSIFFGRGGDDDEQWAEKKASWWIDMAAAVLEGMLLNGTNGGQLTVSMAEKAKSKLVKDDNARVNDFDPLQGIKLMFDSYNDIINDMHKGDYAGIARDAAIRASQMNGVNPETFTNMGLGIWDAIENRDLEALDMMLLLNMPMTKRAEWVKRNYQGADSRDMAEAMTRALGYWSDYDDLDKKDRNRVNKKMK